jgi:hypothetical protein
MVINIHLLLHIPTCVSQNGPLCMYTAYNMEDNMGHLVSMIHGTTDPLKQCAQRYLLEQNLKQQIQTSEMARAYYNQIHNPFKNEKKTLKKSHLNEEERAFVQTETGSQHFIEYENIYNKGNFYKIEDDLSRNGQRKTNDSFLVTKNGHFGQIKSIFSLPNNSLYILLHSTYCLKKRNQTSKYIHFLKMNARPTYTIIEIADIGKKSILMENECNIAYSVIPNIYERN